MFVKGSMAPMRFLTAINMEKPEYVEHTLASCLGPGENILFCTFFFLLKESVGSIVCERKHECHAVSYFGQYGETRVH
jgi:hypothetical protein